ncbi:MAG: DUF2232 domain-containing protein, partial [Methylocystis sp.]|nr:DUF2232 domain-containing protein [Methylocystis sp.]
DIAQEFVLPRVVAAAFAIFAGLGVVEGLAGEIGLIVAMTLGLALALQGLAVAHALLRDSKMSAIALTLVYFLVGLLGWPIVFFTAVGVADTAFSFRARKTEDRGQKTEDRG